VFVNGQASEAAEVGTPGPASQLRVGGFHGYPFLRGALDEVRLSQGVRYRSAFTPPAAPFSVDGQTEALYHFDEGSGQSLTDASGRGRDLTLGTSADADAADLDWISPGVFHPPHRGRFFGKLLRAIFRFRLQDAPTPPSPLVGEGGWGDEGQRRTGKQKITHPAQEIYP
jgi:hypothetical protein